MPQQNDVMGAGLFVPARTRADIQLRNMPQSSRQQYAQNKYNGSDFAGNNILDDVRRLLAQTPGGSVGKGARRRLVNDLFAMRVGGVGAYSSPSSLIEI